MVKPSSLPFGGSRAPKARPRVGPASAGPRRSWRWRCGRSGPRCWGGGCRGPRSLRSPGPGPRRSGTAGRKRPGPPAGPASPPGGRRRRPPPPGSKWRPWPPDRPPGRGESKSSILFSPTFGYLRLLSYRLWPPLYRAFCTSVAGLRSRRVALHLGEDHLGLEEIAVHGQQKTPRAGAA